jgi:general L-amino acid transport system permease protein
MKLLRSLFGTPLNAALSLALIALFGFTMPKFLRWAFLDATWEAISRRACAPDGACWAFVTARFPLFIYGRYPVSERWRVNLCFLLLAIACIGCLFAGRRRGSFLLALLVGVPIVGGVLLVGGVFGLPVVETADWGGLMLNVILSFVTIALALPLGVAMAFARRSRLPVVSWGATAFIEFWRGVPLLAVLFMGLIMLPMFLPDGMTVPNLVRAVVVLTLFESAYLAETVRGGLQGVPSGQAEAAMALGMHHGMAQVLIVLPQALRMSIPGIINIVVDLFKDTTLVSIVGLFDLMGVITQSLKDPSWVGLASEGYTFAAAAFFVCCLLFSLAGGKLEREFREGGPGKRR